MERDQIGRRYDFRGYDNFLTCCSHFKVLVKYRFLMLKFKN